MHDKFTEYAKTGEELVGVNVRSVHRACRVAGQLSRLRTEDQTVVDGIYRTEGPRVRWNTRLLISYLHVSQPVGVAYLLL